jgi:hypothetical protein
MRTEDSETALLKGVTAPYPTPQFLFSTETFSEAAVQKPVAHRGEATVLHH